MGEGQSIKKYSLISAVWLLGCALRAAYLAVQPEADPYFAAPMLDGAYYLDWAHELVETLASPPGAYYLAPLYPHLLALFIACFGTNFLLLYAAQHLVSLATAGLVGALAWRRLGPAAGLAATTLFLAYQPFLFFASCPLGETVALLLLVTALACADRPTATSALAAGALAGLAALVRPNLLFVPLCWICGEMFLRERRRALRTFLGLALVLSPVAVRNYLASGHAVWISANAGITAFHGNGPGAQGTFTSPAGFSGVLRHQRDEATALARARTGLALDPVEADRWWGRQAWRTRLADPWGSARLLGRKCLLLVDNLEHGLDYSPALDANPWRPSIRLGGGAREVPLVPFALILALAAAALVSNGVGGSGGWRVWTAIGACASAPLVFFVSSRYRLPMMALLILPASRGLVGLLTAGPLRRRRALAACAALGCAAISLTVPSGELRRVEIAGNLSNRAGAFKHVGNLVSAERDVREAISLDPRSAVARFNLGVILDASGRKDEAEQAFRDALLRNEGLAEAATNLSVLLIERGAAAEAVPFLQRALRARPGHAPAWSELVTALALRGDEAEARRAAREAERAGVVLDPALLRQIGATNGQSE